MNIIERTQYSADDGETWHSTEAEARKETAEAKAYLALTKHFMDNVCGCLIFAIRENPDALITALRDMGALPFDPVHAAQHGYKDGYRDALEYAVNNGSICLHGLTYAVIPVEQHAKEEAALARVIKYAKAGLPSACDWCDAHGINWKDN